MSEVLQEEVGEEDGPALEVVEVEEEEGCGSSMFMAEEGSELSSTSPSASSSDSSSSDSSSFILSLLNRAAKTLSVPSTFFVSSLPSPPRSIAQDSLDLLVFALSVSGSSPLSLSERTGRTHPQLPPSEQDSRVGLKVEEVVEQESRRAPFWFRRRGSGLVECDCGGMLIDRHLDSISRRKKKSEGQRKGKGRGRGKGRSWEGNGGGSELLTSILKWGLFSLWTPSKTRGFSRRL